MGNPGILGALGNLVAGITSVTAQSTTWYPSTPSIPPTSITPGAVHPLAGGWPPPGVSTLNQLANWPTSLTIQSCLHDFNEVMSAMRKAVATLDRDVMVRELHGWRMLEL